MRYAVMSDVHANPKALDTALADARGRGCDRFVFLGDATGYGYNVKDTIRLVRENFDVVLMGNHDSACVGLEPRFEVETNRNYRVDLRNREELSDEERDWLMSRPYEHSEGDALFVHGDSTDPRAWNYILNSEMVAVNLLACPKPILFCGHSHHAAVWELVEGPNFSENNLDIHCGPRLLKSLSKPARTRVDEHFVKLEERGRYIFNERRERGLPSQRPLLHLRDLRHLRAQGLDTAVPGEPEVLRGGARVRRDRASVLAGGRAVEIADAGGFLL